MTEAISKSTMRALTAPLSGTRPLAKAPDPAAQPTPKIAGDRVSGLSGQSHLERFAQQEDPLDAIRTEARRLMEGMDSIGRQVAERMLESLRGPAEGETLEQFRDKLTVMLVKFKQMVENALAERAAEEEMEKKRFVNRGMSEEWRRFYQSLERYLENLTNMAKIEASILDRNQKEARSQAKFTERLLTAAATLLPEHRFSLLSAHLSQKS